LHALELAIIIIMIILLTVDISELLKSGIERIGFSPIVGWSSGTLPTMVQILVLASCRGQP
jgi:hypothetical protein